MKLHRGKESATRRWWWQAKRGEAANVDQRQVEVKHRQHSIHIRTHSVALCIHIRFDWLWNFIPWCGGEKRKKFNAKIPSFSHQKAIFTMRSVEEEEKKPTEEKNVMLIRRVNKIYHFSSSRFRASEAVRERVSAVEQQWAHIKIAESCEILRSFTTPILVYSSRQQRALGV